jgi:hypothetical protein
MVLSFNHIEIIQSLNACKYSYNKHLFDNSLINFVKIYNSNNILPFSLIYNENKVFLSFRGSINFNDLLVNLRYNRINYDKNIKIHNGYLDTYNKIKPLIIKDLSKIIKNNKQIIFTGHSLGGAIATIAFIDLFKEKNIIKKCYTFGTPPYIMNNINNYTINDFSNKYDIITLFKNQNINKNNKIWNICDNHKLETYYDNIKI